VSREKFENNSYSEQFTEVYRLLSSTIKGLLRTPTLLRCCITLKN